MKKHRPFGVTLLAILALVAALVAVWRTLQALGIAPINISSVSVFVPSAQWVTAFMWVLMAFIYIWVFRMLWAVNAQGWLFVTVISILNLVAAAFDIIGGTAFQIMLPVLAINAIILIYCLVPGTKAAFEVP